MAARKITAEERELREKAHRYLPGGTVGNIKNVMIREGRGGRVWDVSGNEYVDFMLAAGPMLLGHAHPEVVEAVREQAGKGSTFFCRQRESHPAGGRDREGGALCREGQVQLQRV